MKRQSQALLSSAASDAKLMAALLKVEELSKQLEEEKKKHKDKVAYVYMCITPDCAMLSS